MKRLWLIWFLMLAPFVNAQNLCSPNTPLSNGQTCLIDNSGGTFGGMIHILPKGSPSGLTVTIQGGMNATGTVDTANNTCLTSAKCTITSTSEVFQEVVLTAPYNYLLVSATLSGGTSPTVVIDPKVSGATAPSSSGSSVAITSPLDGSGYVNIDCKTGCTGGNPNGQATMANSAPVVIASNQSSVAVTDAQGAAAASTAGWPVTGGNLAEVTAAWTSATGSNTSLTETITGYNSVEVYFNQTTTITGGVATFEASDTAAFTNAYPITCAEANAPAASNTYTFVASTNQAWDCDVSAFVAFRVRLSTVISGTGTVNVGITASAVSTVPEMVDGVYTWGGTVLGAGSNYGTSPGAVAVPGVNAFVTNTPTVTGTSTPSDSVANPTTAVNTQAFNMLWNPVSSDWDRMLSAEAGQNIGPTGVTTSYCGFSTSPTTITNGNFSPLGCDNADNLLVKINVALPTGGNVIGAVTQSGGPWTVNKTQTAGSTLGAITTYGTSPGAVNVESVNSFVTNVPAVTQSGTWTDRIVGNGGASLDATVGVASAPTNGLDTLAQYNTAAPAPTNAQTASLQADQSSNLLTFPGIAFKTGAAWTSGTSGGTFQYPTGTTTAGQLTGAAAVIVQLDQTTTITGGAVTFQGTYDNVNWVTIPVAQVVTPGTLLQLTNPYTLVASTNQPFELILDGYSNVRADLSTAISGTATVTPYWATLSAPSGIQASNTFINGVATLSAQAGVQKVGVVGHTGGNMDGTITAATAPTNGLMGLVEYLNAAPAPTTGQSVGTQSDGAGTIFTRNYRRSQNAGQATTISSTGATTIVTAQAASTFADIANLVVTVTPQASTAVQFTVTLSDGTNSYIYDCDTGVTAATSTEGTCVNIAFNPPLPATSAATAWTLNESSAQTIHVTVNYVKQLAN